MKIYVKPVISIANLRPEEGLACYGSYDNNDGGSSGGYGSNFWWSWWQKYFKK